MLYELADIWEKLDNEGKIYLCLSAGLLVALLVASVKIFFENRRKCRYKVMSEYYDKRKSEELDEACEDILRMATKQYKKENRKKAKQRTRKNKACNKRNCKIGRRMSKK